MCGCELSGDRPSKGYYQYSYDGRDFVALDTKTLSWTAADATAEITKKEWEAEPAIAQRWKGYLEENCIDWLQKYLRYGRESLQRKEPPEVTVTRKDGHDGLETLLCRAHGFYPREIDATWRRDGEARQGDTFRGTVSPNADGTYYTWLSIEVDPQERSRFRCHVEHDGLREPLDMAVEESVPVWLVAVGVVLLGVLLVLAVAGIFLYLSHVQAVLGLQKAEEETAPCPRRTGTNQAALGGSGGTSSSRVRPAAAFLPLRLLLCCISSSLRHFQPYLYFGYYTPHSISSDITHLLFPLPASHAPPSSSAVQGPAATPIQTSVVVSSSHSGKPQTQPLMLSISATSLHLPNPGERKPLEPLRASPARGRDAGAGSRMGRLRWPAWLLLGALVLLQGGRAGTSSHSLRYFYTAVSASSQGLPRFVAVGYVDDQLIEHYDSDTRRVTPRVPWMAKAGEEHPWYWDRNTQASKGWEATFRADLETLRHHYHRSAEV
ncbi:hypothetical protein lerEdw1_000743 [Lerista edwardsae]|nr:hypothetical protein lerEdw1_000743 [Lerista edwardsae]